MRTFLGIDIGGTETKYGVYDESGTELQAGKIVTMRADLELFVDSIGKIITEHQDVCGIGVSVPGFIDVHSGLIINGGAIRVLDGHNLRKLLRPYTTLQMEFENDANCVVLAEKWLGNGQNYENFLAVTIGTGIGGGIMIHNQLYRGSRFMAGEFGYMFVNGVGARKARDVELNELASTRILVAQAEQLLNVEPGMINGKILFHKLEQGNEQLMGLYEQWIHYLALGMYNLIYCFNPQAILIGGGISAQPRVLKDIKTAIEKINPLALHTTILGNCKFGNDAGKIGAIYHYIQQEKQKIGK
ncbi:MAG: ROK family protein [Bacillaceae bacterium]